MAAVRNTASSLCGVSVLCQEIKHVSVSTPIEFSNAEGNILTKATTAFPLASVTTAGHISWP